MPDIEIDEPTIFSLPRCVQCTAVKRKLTEQGVKYQEVDASQIPEALTLIKDTWGYLGAPVTYFKGKHFTGYDPDKLDDVISDYQKVAA
jgi:glutaredoxin-like protein NrdH